MVEEKFNLHNRFAINGRYIPQKSDAGKLFFKLTYKPITSFEIGRLKFGGIDVGVSYRPLIDRVRLEGSWLLFQESTKTPAIIVASTVDDFINDNDTEVNSRVYSAVASKSITEWKGVNFAPYIGGAYIDALDELRLVGGLFMSKGKWSNLWIYSGTDVHTTISYTSKNNIVTSFVYWGLKYPGMAVTWSF